MSNAALLAVGWTADRCRRSRGSCGLRHRHSRARDQACRAFPYRVYTHCGIDEAGIGSRYFEAVHPLSDGQGNPPAGWGNPYQQGTMTLLSPSKAVFRDDAGHQVQFRLRPGATSFKRLCD